MRGPESYWYAWKPVRYRNRTMGLTLAQDGLYRRLIDYYMETRQPLPNGPLALAAICRISPEQWAENSPAVMRYFSVRGTKLIQKHCAGELDSQNVRTQERSKSGKMVLSKDGTETKH
jgi:uncharacterized protein YdaU (DUF1376 family)